MINSWCTVRETLSCSVSYSRRLFHYVLSLIDCGTIHSLVWHLCTCHNLKSSNPVKSDEISGCFFPVAFISWSVMFPNLCINNELMAWLANDTDWVDNFSNACCDNPSLGLCLVCLLFHAACLSLNAEKALIKLLKY